MSNNDIQSIIHELNQQAEQIARQILHDPHIQRQGNELRFGRKGSMRIFINGPKIGRWTNYEDGTYGDMLNFIEHYMGQNTADAINTAKMLIGWDTSEQPTITAQEREQKNIERKSEEQEENERRIKRARAIWAHSQPLDNHTHPYLKNRAIPPLSDTSWIRQQHIPTEDRKYLHLPDTIDDAPISALIFGATNADNQLQAVQRILIQHDKKLRVDTPKRTYGYMQGSAVRFDTPTHELYVGEGPETSLSWRESTHTPTWCILGLSNLLHIAIPPDVTTLNILVDLEEDGAGITGAIRACNYIQSKYPNITVQFLCPDNPYTPKLHIDFNDVLQQHPNANLRELPSTHILTPPPHNPNKLIIANDPRLALQHWSQEGGLVYILPKQRPEITLFHYIQRHASDTTQHITIIGHEHQLGTPIDVTAPITWYQPNNIERARNPYKPSIAIYNDQPNTPIIMASTYDDAQWINGPASAWNPHDNPEHYDWEDYRGRNVVLAFPHTEQGMKGAALAARHIEEVNGTVWMGPMPPKRIPEGVSPFDGRGFSITRARTSGWTPEQLRANIIRESIRITLNWDNICTSEHK